MSREVHPGRLTTGTWKWWFGRWFSFSIGWFLGSMLIFRGVCDVRSGENDLWGPSSSDWMVILDSVYIRFTGRPLLTNMADGKCSCSNRKCIDSKLEKSVGFSIAMLVFVGGYMVGSSFSHILPPKTQSAWVCTSALHWCDLWTSPFPMRSHFFFKKKHGWLTFLTNHGST